MQLSDAQLSRYREQGFLALPEFFSTDDTRAMQEEVARLVDLGLLRNTAAGDGQESLQVVIMWRYSELFRAMPFHPRVAQTAAQIVGDPVMLYMDQILLKPARHGIGTNWHQDNHYFKFTDPFKGVGIWVAVNEATRANGAMRFIPGSQGGAYPHVRDPESDHQMRTYPDASDEVIVELPAGGVVVFTYNTVHATARNETDRPRAGYAMHFANIPAAATAGPNYALDSSQIDYTPGRPGRPFISGPQASGGMREYGVDCRSRWD